MIAEPGILTETGIESVESAMWQEMMDVLRPPDLEFRERYWSDPASFVEDCFRWDALKPNRPAKYQLEALTELYAQGRACVRSPHGAGKTACAAWAILHFALTRDGLNKKWIIPTTASAWRQLQKFLWPELHFWVRMIDWEKVGRKPFSRRTELFAWKLKLSTGEAFAMAASDAANLEGAHAPHLLYVFDEAKTIPIEIWDAAEGALSTPGECYALAFSTPGEPSGRFYDIQSRKRGYDDWWVRHIEKREVVTAGRMSKKWAAQRLKQWGENSAVYQNRVLGEFATDAEDGVIPLSWVEAAVERWHEWQDAGGEGVVTSIGVDPSGGRAGSNIATIAVCKDFVKIDRLHEIPIGDPDESAMAIAGYIRGKLRVNKGACAYVDPIGIGSGILHRLLEMNMNVRGYHASKGTELFDSSGEVGFLNWRAAGWWLLREMLTPNSKFGVCLPPDADGLLVGDLTTPKQKMTSRGMRQVEAKESIKRRLGRSTDYGDAVIHALIGQLLCDEEDTKKGPGRIWYKPVRIGPDF